MSLMEDLCLAEQHQVPRQLQLLSRHRNNFETSTGGSPCQQNMILQDFAGGWSVVAISAGKALGGS
jgi:hypothetical protein